MMFLENSITLDWESSLMKAQSDRETTSSVSPISLEIFWTRMISLLKMCFELNLSRLSSVWRSSNWISLVKSCRQRDLSYPETSFPSRMVMPFYRND